MKQYLPINCCFLKKIKMGDQPHLTALKHGFRIWKGEIKFEFFTDSLESFNKW